MAAVVPPAAPVLPVAPELLSIEQAIVWIGFSIDAQRDTIVDELGDDLEGIGNMTIKEMTELSESYAKRTQTDGRIIFGLQRRKGFVPLYIGTKILRGPMNHLRSTA